ncbi:MAG: tetratricopeptide repeat protein [Bacteroidota bacterium]
MLRFAHPEYLWLLGAIPVLALALFIAYRWRRRLLTRFISEPLFAQLVPDMSGAKRAGKQTLLLAAVGLLILALANPQVGTRLEEVKRKGIDVFVALDVSLSMKAEDIRPSRLEKAKRDVSSLLRKLRGDRVGLIVFAGDAFVQFPLTADYSAADLFISAVDVDAVPTPGTMIGAAIDKALQSFRKDLPTQKAIIVVSDGENTEGDVSGATKKAKEAGVRVYTVGMGTPDGSPIPLYSGGQRVDYKRDRAGSIVLTRLDETTLQQIAVATGGVYRRATSGGNEIEDIFNELSALQKTEMGSLQVAGYQDQFHYPLAAAIFLLVLEHILSERKGKFIARLMRLVPVAKRLSVLALMAVSLAHAQTVRSHVNTGNDDYSKKRFPEAETEYKKALEEDPTSRIAQFDLGNAYYKQGRFEEAQRSYNASMVNAPTAIDQAAAYHNIGNALFKAGKVAESLEAYKQALKLNPTDDETRYNYQLAKDRLKQQSQQQQQNKNNQNKDQQQEQQKNQQQQPQQSQQQEAKQNQAKQQQAQQQKNQMSKQEAEQILQALRNKEVELQKQLRKRAGARIKPEKDW